MVLIWILLRLKWSMGRLDIPYECPDIHRIVCKYTYMILPTSPYPTEWVYSFQQILKGIFDLKNSNICSLKNCKHVVSEAFYFFLNNGNGSGGKFFLIVVLLWINVNYRFPQESILGLLSH